jgi:hypothetical protein
MGWTAMTLKARSRHLPILAFLAVALASSADAQMSTGAATPGTGAANGGAGAERLIYGVDAGLGETDNVTLVPTNKVSQTIATVDADLDIKHRSSRLDVDAKGNFTDFAYLEGAFGNQLLGRFDGVARFALIPQRITWVLADDFGQAALDPFAPTTPGNLEDINYVSTGPDFALRMGGLGFLDASARIARATYQTSPFNSNRVLGSLAAGLQLSPRSTVSLNGVAERVLFDNTAVNGDFNRTSAYLRYDIQGARTSLSVDLGATKISQNSSAGTSTIVLDPTGKPISVPVTIPQNAYTTTGPLARIQLTRDLSPAARVTLSGGRELVDGISSFSSIRAGAIGVVGTLPAFLTSSSYTSTFGSAAWQYQRNRTKVGVSANWGNDVYVSQPQFDVKRVGGEVNLSRKLSRAFGLQVLGRYYKNDYPNPALITLAGGSPKFDDSLFAAILSWRYSRVIEMRLRVEHGSRTTTGADLGYRENRIFLTVGYRPWTEDTFDSSAPFESTGSNDSSAIER